MRARIANFFRDSSGKQKLVLELDGDFSKQFDEYNGHDIDVVVKKWHPKHTDDQRRYAWVLIEKIAKKLHLTKTEVYRNMIKDIPDVSVTQYIAKNAVEKMKKIWESNGQGWFVEEYPCKKDDWSMVVCYYGMSVYDKQQLADFIDGLILSCQELNIDWQTDADKETLEKMRRDYGIW